MFKDVDPSLMIPLAANIELRVYSHKQVILEKGQKPEGLYIIYSGNAEVVTKNLFPKTKPPEFRRPRKTPIPFYVGSYTPGNSNDKLIGDRQERVRKIVRLNRLERNERRKKVEQNMTYAKLKDGDWFGGRALLEGDVIEEMTKDYSINLKTMKILPSKFSVVSHSTQLLVYVVTKEIATYLNREVQSKVKDFIQKSYEVDCPEEVNPLKMEQMLNYWASYKEILVDSIHRHSYAERHKGSLLLTRN